MSLSTAELESLRRYLGYPGDQSNAQAIAARCVSHLTVASEGTIRLHLRQLDRIQQQITTVLPFAAQTFSSGAGGTQQYAPGQRLATLHTEANQYIDEIAHTAGLLVYRRIYGGAAGGGGGWSAGRTVRG